MRFEDVTNRLAAEVQYPGHRHHGMKLNEAIPAMSTIRIWQAVHGGYTWVIAYDPGLPQWSPQDRARYQGYTASYRRTKDRGPKTTIAIDGGPWKTYTEAEAACRSRWKGIRQPQ